MTTASVLGALRRQLRDRGEMFTSRVPGDGMASRFELPQDTIDPATFRVAIGLFDDSLEPEIVDPDTYRFDSDNGIVWLSAPVPEHRIAYFSGVSYETFVDQDLIAFIEWAFEEFTQGRDPPVYLDPISMVPPSPVLTRLEERAVVLLAGREVYRDLATAAAREFTIDTGDGTVIPQSTQFQQYTQMAGLLDQQYQSLIDRLGIQSADTIQVGTLRRVSMSTNRLVPIYKAREWDARHFPERIMPPIDIGIGQQGIKVTYKGRWESDRYYEGGGVQTDMVDWESSRYLALQPSRGINPVEDIAAGDGQINGRYWQLTFLNSGVTGYYSPL